MPLSSFFGRSSATPDAPTQDDFEKVEHADANAQPMDVTDQGQAPAAESTNVREDARDANVNKPFRIEASVEKGEVTHKEESSVLGMISVRAPEASDSAARPALDLVVCMDRSGSMRGSKIKLVKDTLDSLVMKTGLNAQDRLSIVSFDTTVATEMPLMSMDVRGKTRAEQVVGKLVPGSTTNLSGGLLQSIDILNTNPSTDASRTRAVLLFTDGMANHGITDQDQLNLAVKGVVAGTSTKIFTFGFGEDHNENMLRGIASEGDGLYYYIKSVDDIGTAFADCLGGIMSVVGQNATLTLNTPHSVGKVLGNYKTGEFKPGDKAVVIELGDLYSEDERDVLFEMRLPVLAAPDPQATPQVTAQLRVFSVATSRFEEVTVPVQVARPTETPPNQTINLRIDEQRNRMIAAEALENAANLADTGNLTGGRMLLQQALAACKASPANSAGSDLSAGLIAQLEEVELTYSDTVQYRSMGSKMSRMHATSNYQQKATHMSADMYKGGGSRKAAVKRSWGLSSE